MIIYMQKVQTVEWSTGDNYTDWTPVACGFYTAPTSGKWKWDAVTNTWLLDEEVPPVNEIYAAPETPKLTPEAKQERLWDLLKQAAGG